MPVVTHSLSVMEQELEPRWSGSQPVSLTPVLTYQMVMGFDTQQGFNGPGTTVRRGSKYNSVTCLICTGWVANS